MADQHLLVGRVVAGGGVVASELGHGSNLADPIGRDGAGGVLGEDEGDVAGERQS